MIKGIDVSKHNGTIDFNKVRAAGYSFVIIRAGYGMTAAQKDPMFEANYTKAKAAGLDVGAYWYSYAVTTSDARAEAYACLDVIRGKSFEYPIFFDLEERKQLATGKENCSQMVMTFCDKLTEEGYYPGLYMSRSHLQTHIRDDVSVRFPLWVAEYNAKCNYDKPYGMWQKSAKGSVNGITGDVDIDECYVDHPSVIKDKGLNGFRAESTSSESKTYCIVLDGDKGEAQEALKLLKLGGYEAKIAVIKRR